MAALEALLPEELEQHCQLQQARSDTYQKWREEVVLYAEARGYVAPKLGQVSKAQKDRWSCGCWRILTMEGTTHLQRKGEEPQCQRERRGTQWRQGERSSKGRCEVFRTIEHAKDSRSGKTGHQSKDCWAKQQQQQNQRQSNSSGNGNDAKGKSGKWKETLKLENLVGLSRLNETPSCEHGNNKHNSWHDRHGRMHVVGSVEVVNPRRIVFNVDTGAGRTVWPKNADYACEKISSCKSK